MSAEVRAKLKNFQRQFKAKHGRDPTKADIQQHPDIAEAYAVYNASRKGSSSSALSGSGTSVSKYARNLTNVLPSSSSALPQTPTKAKTRQAPSTGLPFPFKTPERPSASKARSYGDGVTDSLASSSSAMPSPFVPPSASKRSGFAKSTLAITPQKRKSPSQVFDVGTDRGQGSSARSFDFVPSPHRLRNLIGSHSISGSPNKQLKTASERKAADERTAKAIEAETITPRTKARKRLRGEDVPATPGGDGARRARKAKRGSGAFAALRKAGPDGGGVGDGAKAAVQDVTLEMREDDDDEEMLGPSPSKPFTSSATSGGRVFTSLFDEDEDVVESPASSSASASNDAARFYAAGYDTADLSSVRRNVQSLFGGAGARAAKGAGKSAGGGAVEDSTTARSMASSISKTAPLLSLRRKGLRKKTSLGMPPPKDTFDDVKPDRSRPGRSIDRMGRPHARVVSGQATASDEEEAEMWAEMHGQPPSEAALTRPVHVGLVAEEQATGKDTRTDADVDADAAPLTVRARRQNPRNLIHYIDLDVPDDEDEETDGNNRTRAHRRLAILPYQRYGSLSLSPSKEMCSEPERASSATATVNSSAAEAEGGGGSLGEIGFGEGHTSEDEEEVEKQRIGLPLLHSRRRSPLPSPHQHENEVEEEGEDEGRASKSGPSVLESRSCSNEGAFPDHYPQRSDDDNDHDGGKKRVFRKDISVDVPFTLLETLSLRSPDKEKRLASVRRKEEEKVQVLLGEKKASKLGSSAWGGRGTFEMSEDEEDAPRDGAAGDEDGEDEDWASEISSGAWGEDAGWDSDFEKIDLV